MALGTRITDKAVISAADHILGIYNGTSGRLPWSTLVTLAAENYKTAFSVKSYGAVADAVKLSAGAISAAGTTFVDTGATFTSADVGKLIQVDGAGAAGVPLVTTIASYTSATTVELTDAASTTVSGAVSVYGTDNTTAIQAAINAASNDIGNAVYVPAGHYLYQTLRLYYDATDNPDFSQTSGRHGNLCFEGVNSLRIADMRVYNPITGSILESVGAGIIVASSSAGHGADPYPARHFEAQGITFVANNDTYVIETAACPQFSLRRCGVLQRNTAGDGILLQSAWYTLIDQTLIFGASGSAGTGIVGGTATFAGLYTIRSSLIDRWSDGFDWQTGDHSNIHFQDTSIQNCTRNSIRASGGAVRHMLVTNCYFEGTSREHDIRGISTTIRQLLIDSTFFLCGDGASASYLSERVIELDSVHAITFKGLDIFRLRVPFCKVTAVDNSGSVAGFVSDLLVRDDTGTPASAFALFEGVLPDFGPGIVWPDYADGYYDGTSDVKLFDETAATPSVLTDRRTGVTSQSRMALGDVLSYPGQTTAITLTPTTSGSVVSVDVDTGAGVALNLPNQDYLPGGRLYLVRCESVSAGNLVVKNAVGGTTVQSLAPGETCLVVLDQAAAAYYVAIPPFSLTQQTALTDLTDNSGGSADDTIEACGTAVTGVDGTGSNAASKADVDTRLTAIANNIADLTARLNALNTLLSDAQVTD